MFNDVIFWKKIFLPFIIRRNHIKYMYIEMYIFPSPEFEAIRGFPNGGTSGKESKCNAGDTRDEGSILRSGRSP